LKIKNCIKQAVLSGTRAYHAVLDNRIRQLWTLDFGLWSFRTQSCIAHLGSRILYFKMSKSATPKVSPTPKLNSESPSSQLGPKPFGTFNRLAPPGANRQQLRTLGHRNYSIKLFPVFCPYHPSELPSSLQPEGLPETSRGVDAFSFSRFSALNP
jgi:hypothetical protein